MITQRHFQETGNVLYLKYNIKTKKATSAYFFSISHCCQG